MKKKSYQKPVTRVARIQHRLQMLSASNNNSVKATMNSPFEEVDLGE